MKTMKLRWLLLAALTLLICITALPAMAEKNSTSGDAGDTSVFYVDSYGNAKITFTQTEGLCYEKNSLGQTVQNDEWGKYHIYVETPYGGTYSEDWDKTYYGSTYTLSLGSSGLYRIRVVPYTANEISASWALDKFVRWSSYPSWWISSRQNCNIMSTVSVSVYVQQVDQKTGAVLGSRSVTVSTGNNSVSAGSTPSGYTIVGSSTATVYVDKSGRADKSTVTFYYRRNENTKGTVSVTCVDENGYTISSYTETITSSTTLYPKNINNYTATSGGQYVSFNSSTGQCNPSTIRFIYKKNSNPPGPGPIPGPTTPTSWDTKFKPGSSSKNPEGINNLYKLTDDNPSTVFAYTLYNSDKNNGLPDFTAYFNNASVSGIKIRNGDGSNYYRYMRVNTFYVKVYTNSGTYTESQMTIPDSRSSDYYSFSFRQRYTGVTRIEIYITDRHVGQGDDTNRVRIRDIAFY